MSNYFIGVDAGGTTTRALVATAYGRIAGVGRAPGANIWSSGTSASHVISGALRAALHAVEPASVARGVIAVAGPATTRLNEASELGQAWRSLGLPGTPDLVPDVLAAYAAATTEPDGLVLVAGTGAIAASIGNHDVVQRAGGHGWLVGDQGSAVWLGIEGIRAAIRAIDGTGPETALVSAICEQLHIEMTTGRPVARDIVTTAHSQPPAQLGQLAPVVVAACDEQDEVALRLVETAAGHLADTAAAAARDVQPAVVVLAGSLLTKAAPIRRLVRATLSERWPGTPITEAASGEAGAAALAISRHQGACIDDKTLGRLRGETPVAT